MTEAAVVENADQACRAMTVPGFCPAKKFLGARPGYYFALGHRGLGYYCDCEFAIRRALAGAEVNRLAPLKLRIGQLLLARPGEHHGDQELPPRTCARKYRLRRAGRGPRGARRGPMTCRPTLTQDGTRNAEGQDLGGDSFCTDNVPGHAPTGGGLARTQDGGGAEAGGGFAQTRPPPDPIILDDEGDGQRGPANDPDHAWWADDGTVSVLDTGHRREGLWAIDTFNPNAWPMALEYMKVSPADAIVLQETNRAGLASCTDKEQAAWE